MNADTLKLHKLGGIATRLMPKKNGAECTWSLLAADMPEKLRTVPLD